MFYLTMTRVYIYIFFIFRLIQAAPTDKWEQCNCRWGDWAEWQDCSKQCGGGRRSRDRWVWWTRDRGCNEFDDCATSGGWDYSDCNAFCYNGGTFKRISSRYQYCICPLGWKGSCCDEEVTCGDPGTISHGRRYVSSYRYSSTVRYTCSNYYRMVGSSSQKCKSSGYWSGSKPRCVFANTCQSNPCQNGGTCVNDLERYDCQCRTGWSGVNCEIDVQPPVLSGCQGDVTKYIATPTVIVNWTVPTFRDPMNTELKLTSNYPQNNWEFRWGDYLVQYVATKVLNGLKSECVFNIKIRPHQCSPLDEPEDHAAKVCSNWMTDYGRYCLVFCDKSYTLVDEGDYDHWYICGASGRWLPSQTLPRCSRFFDATARHTRDQFHYDDCSNSTSIDQMKDIFLGRIRASAFSYFCQTYEDQCIKANVDVTCR